MSRKDENQGFLCEACGTRVLPLSNGSYRNHCPKCLYSKHLDNKLGDRSAGCGGLMAPVDWTYHGKKGYQVIHECRLCGKRQANRIAEDDDFLAYLLKKRT